MRRRFLFVLLIALTAVPALPGSPAEAQVGPDGIYPMVFPLAAPYRLTDSFGDARPGGRSHEGVDIMADGKGQEVYAAAAGTVRWIGTTCCYLAIEHDDGWETWYIHLNNDTQNPDGTYSDDGLGEGIADGIEVGTRVEAGQLIGWSGDSGNAEGSTPHLHFELRDPNDVAVDPLPSLQAAESGLTRAAPLCPEEETCDTVAFHGSGGRFDLWASLSLNPAINSFLFGNPGDVAFSGDWDCDGVESPGLYRRSDGYVYLRNSNTQGVADLAFFFGDPGDYPLAGDFDNDGCDTVSIYRPAEQTFYVINTLGSDDGGLGAAEYSFGFGNPGDKPFVGDFNNDGIDTVGLHRESTGLVYFRDSNSTGVADNEFIYGDPGDRIVAGDWDGDGDDSVGVYRPSAGEFFLKYDNTAGFADATFTAGDYIGVIALLP